MGELLSELSVRIVADATAMKTALQESESGLKNLEKQAKMSTEEINKSYETMGKTLIGVGAAFLATFGLMGKAAANAVESESLFTVSLDDNADAVRDWSETLRKSVGLNAYEVRKNVGTFYVMLEAMGLTSDEALDMSKSMTNLAYDMASFYNLDTEEAFNKIKSGIVGMPRPLQDLGIVINETAAQTYALKVGMIEEGQEMTNQQKILARYGALMEQTSKSQGDLARTMDSPANKMRILKSTFEEFNITVGETTIPILSSYMDIITTSLAGLDNFAKENKSIVNNITSVGISFGEATASVGVFMFGLSKLSGFLSGMGVSFAKLSGWIAVATAGLYLINEGMKQLSRNSINQSSALSLEAERVKYLAGEENNLNEAMLERALTLREYTKESAWGLTKKQEEQNYAIADALEAAYNENVKLIASQKEKNEATQIDIDKTNKSIEAYGALVNEYYYTKSSAGQLGLTMKDLYNRMMEDGVAIETINSLYTEYGEGIENVLPLLEAMGEAHLKTASSINQEIKNLESLNKMNQLNQAQSDRMTVYGNVSSGLQMQYDALMTRYNQVSGANADNMTPEVVAYLADLQQQLISLANQMTGITPGNVLDILNPESHATGGIVGGQVGEPRLIMAHGGEEVLRRDERGGNTIIVQGSVISERNLTDIVTKGQYGNKRKDYTTGL
jgi:predicted nucleic acid-binding protein